MFKGEYYHSLDEKGRLIMPSRLRQGLGDKFVATKGLDGCLFVYPIPEWSVLEEKLENLPFMSGDFRTFNRLFLSGAADCEFDRQGRFSIPQNLREYAKIDKDVAVIGVSNRIEIWSRAGWEEYQASKYPSFEALAEKIVDARDED